MKILLMKFTDKEILKKLFEIYPNQKNNLEGYLKALNELRSKRSRKSKMKILIHVVKANEFNDEDYVRVSGYDPDDKKTSYAIEYNNWSKWLGMDFHPDTLKNFNELDIVAYCLWEMTWAGYSNKSVRGEIRMLNKRVEDIESGKAKGIPLEDLKT